MATMVCNGVNYVVTCSCTTAYFDSELGFYRRPVYIASIDAYGGPFATHSIATVFHTAHPDANEVRAIVQSGPNCYWVVDLESPVEVSCPEQLAPAGYNATLSAIEPSIVSGNKALYKVQLDKTVGLEAVTVTLLLSGSEQEMFNYPQPQAVIPPGADSVTVGIETVQRLNGADQILTANIQEGKYMHAASSPASVTVNQYPPFVFTAEYEAHGHGNTLGLANAPAGAVIDWGDGSAQVVTEAGQDYTHTYTAVSGNEHGYYGHISFPTGDVAYLSFGGPALRTIEQWPANAIHHVRVVGPGSLVSRNLNSVPAQAPEGLTSLKETFWGAHTFNAPLSGWDVSQVTDMTSTFEDALAFNQDISNWNTSNVVSMSKMFSGAVVFDQPLNSWNVSAVTSMEGMFAATQSFDRPLDNWNVGNVLNMDTMFYVSEVFNQDLSMWCVNNIVSAPYLFDEAAFSWTLPRPVWGTCP